jgi:hypothetical protein
MVAKSMTDHIPRCPFELVQVHVHASNALSQIMVYITETS